MNSSTDRSGHPAIDPKEHSHPMTTAAELQRLTDDMMACVRTLKAALGDSAAVRRIVNDVERISNGIDRLDIDLQELGQVNAAVRPQPVQMIQISDADYDLDFWRDVDHEGVGTQTLACGKPSK